MSEQVDSQDRTVICGDCGQGFTWTAREQDFFRERNFAEPKRCKECRQANKARREEANRHSETNHDH